MKRWSVFVAVLLVVIVGVVGSAKPGEAANSPILSEYRVLIGASEKAFNELGGEGFDLFYANSETGVFIFKRQPSETGVEYRVVKYTPNPDLDSLGAEGWLLNNTYFGNYVFTRRQQSPAVEYFAVDRQDWLRAVEGIVEEEFGEQFDLVDLPFQSRINLPSEPLIEAELILLNRLGNGGWLLNERGTPGFLVFTRMKGSNAKSLEYYVVGRDEWASVAEESPMSEQNLLNELGADGWYILSRGLPANLQATVFVREKFGDVQWEYHVIKLYDWSRVVDERMLAGRSSVPIHEALVRVPEVQQEMLNEIGAEGWKRFGGSRVASYIFTRQKDAGVQIWEYLVIGPPQWDEMVEKALAERKAILRFEPIGNIEWQVQQELLAELGAEGWEIVEPLHGGAIVFQRPGS